MKSAQPNSYPDWTKILGEAGLEAPGYHEAVKAAREATAEKKEQERLAREEKQTQQRRKRVPKTG
jgi:hypothetical protein